MNTFGDTRIFAVSYELNQEHGGSWLYGKFCYWIGGEIVGDYELGTSLRDMITVLSPIVKDNGNRQNDSLYQLSIKELHKRLDDSLFGNDAENYKYKNIALDECWSRFNICPEIDIFDYWSIYLVESSSSKKDIFEVNLKAGLFDGIIQDVYDALIDISSGSSSNGGGFGGGSGCGGSW